MEYRLLIAMEVLAFLERLPLKHRRLLRDAIAGIGRDPAGRSDAVDHDETGRVLHISITGDFAFVYWIDDADRHIKILDVHSADR